jgi:hypothetical protein
MQIVPICIIVSRLETAVKQNEPRIVFPGTEGEFPPVERKHGYAAKKVLFLMKMRREYVILKRKRGELCEQGTLDC